MKPKKTLSEQLREERLKIEASAIESTIEQEIKKKRTWKYSTAKFYLKSEDKMNRILAGEIKTPIVKKKFAEPGKRGPKPSPDNSDLARFHHGMDRKLATKMREYSKRNGVSVRRIVEDGIKLYFLRVENEK